MPDNGLDFLRLHKCRFQDRLALFEARCPMKLQNAELDTKVTEVSWLKACVHGADPNVKRLCTAPARFEELTTKSDYLSS